MYELYDFLPSGNSYKVRLLLNQLQIPYRRIDVNILNNETRSPKFLAINPNGRIPVLKVASDKYLAESNAILFYLSQDTAYFPSQKLEQAEVMQWLFFEQYSHEPNIATSRYWIKILQQADKYREQLKQKRELGYAALEVMEKHLSDRGFMVAERYTIADIAFYAYTHVANEGEFDLTEFPAIQAWLNRIEAQPRYISIVEK